MDVRCERCNSEYEFEEARIPDAGLSVKCSSCGHVFRVFKPGPANTFTGGGEWLVRQANGNVLSFRELTTLQRWIVERKVSRDDEISKTGKQWKRLGNIAELATFFQVVEAQPPAPPAASAYGTGPQPPMAYPPQPSYAPPAAAWDQTQQQAPGWNQPSGRWQMGTGPVATGPGGPISTGPLPTGIPTGPTELGSGDDDFDDEFQPRRGGMGKWILIILLLLGGGAAGAYFYKPSLFKDLFHHVDELALNHVKAGYTELDRDSYAAIDRAIDNFDKAVSIDPNYPDARAGSAEAELSRAEYLAAEADEAAAQLPQLPEADRATASAKIDGLRREAIQRGERAFNAAKEALRLDPEAMPANRAMADYYRFNKAFDQMRPLIERAKAKAPSDGRVAYVLGSSVAGDAASLDRAERYFDEALEGDADNQRARYKLARCFAAAGDKEKALVQLENILKAVPDHERAKSLLAQLKPEPVAAPQPEGKKAMSFDQLVAQAERLRDNEQPEKALALYEKADDIEANDPDVLTGMGWCYVDMEEPAPAITSFKQALDLAPRLTDAHMGLAEAYRLKGDKQGAIQHYKAYLDILPTGPEAPVARRMIESLK